MKPIEVDTSWAEPLTYYSLGHYFPFVITSGLKNNWTTQWKTPTEAQYHRERYLQKWYKTKAKNVSKKTRRSRKEIAKFNRLANEAKIEADTIFEANLEFFV